MKGLERCNKKRKETFFSLVVTLFIFLLFAGVFSLESTAVFAAVPTHGTPILNSTLGTNLSTDNLTVYNITTADADGDAVKNIINWYRNNTPIAVLNMPFEGGSNATNTSDYSGNPNRGNVSGATWSNASGYDGFGAYTFDGQNDNIAVTDTTLLNTTEVNHTFSIWFNATPNQDKANPRMFDQFTGGTPGAGLLLFMVNTSGRITFEERATTNFLTITSPASTSYNDSKWHHVVVVVNVSAQHGAMYVDGALVGTDTYTGTLIHRPTNFFIGSAGGTSQIFEGVLDDFIMYREVALTSQQVLLLYQNRTDTIASPLLVVNETWNASITPNDGTGDGVTKFSTNLTIRSTPTIETPAFNVTTITITSGVRANTTYRDQDGDSGSIFFRWFRNNTEVFTENFTTIAAGTIVNTTLNTTFYNRSDLLNLTVYAFDGNVNSTTNFSTTLTVANIVPTHGTPILNSTLGTNLSTDNLTVYNITTADADGDAVKNIINWYRNNTPIAVLNMPFEGGSNATNTSDYSGNLNHGNVSGATWSNSSGYDGKGAYTFDGQNDNIAMTDTTLLNTTEVNHTFSIWFNATPNQDKTNPRMFDQFVGGAPGAGPVLFMINTSGRIQFEERATTDAISITTAASTSYNDSRWHHVVVVVNVSAQEGAMYVDGALVGTDTYTGTLIHRPTNFFIGGDGGTLQPFEGVLDDFIMYSGVALTSQQALLLYQNRTNLIDTSMLQRGDTWNASITPNDRTADGTTKFTTNLTINRLPTVETPVFNLSTVTKTSGIKANTTYRDADNDNARVSFRWFRNNSEIFTENITSITVDTIVNSTLSVNLYNRTDLINVTVFADDAKENSTTNFSTTLTVANTAPSAETPVFNVSTVTKTSGIAANTTVRDVDRDATRVSFRWFRNDTEIFTQNFTGITVDTIVNSTLSVNLYNRTDLINVTVFADDGNANSTTNFSTTLTVANTAPSAETPVFNLSTVTKTTGIAANTTVRDVDRDATRVSFRWFRNNSEIFTQNFTGITVDTIVNSTLSVNLYNRTDLINVTVFADDGNVNSSTNFSTTLTVANTAPSAETPVFNVSTVTKASGIKANTTVRDVDRDATRVSFRWFRNNSEIFTENITGITVDTIVNSTLSVNLYNRTDLINVTVFADDGNANSTTNFSTTLTVANTAPSAETPVFNLSTVTKTTGIAANTTFRDADRDNARVSFRWFRNDTEIFTQNFTGITVDTIVNSTLSVNLYNRTDLINVTVFADDGNANSTTNFSTTLTVANTAPTQGTPILNSTRGGNNTDENLTAFNVSVSDPDNDGITTYFEWFNNSRSVLNTTTNILSTENLSGGDKWYVQVIASDLNGNSSPINTSNVTINALSITLLTPENASRRNNTNQEFTFNTTIGAATICSLFNNASGAYQNRSSVSTIIQLGNNSINHTSIPEASAIFWNIECLSPAGSRVFAPANFSLIIDRTAPNVSQITPTAVTSGQDNNFTATVSDIDSISSCNLFIRGTNDGAMTVSGTTASRIANIISSSDTTIIVYANCTDPLGNINFNATNVVVTAVSSGIGELGGGEAGGGEAGGGLGGVSNIAIKTRPIAELVKGEVEEVETEKKEAEREEYILPDNYLTDGDSFALSPGISIVVKQMSAGEALISIEDSVMHQKYSNTITTRTIAEIGQDITLIIGEFVEADLDNDGITDVIITLDNIVQRNKEYYGNFRIEYLNATDEIITFADEQKEQNEQRYLQKIEQEQEETARISLLPNLWKYVLALLLVVLLVGIVTNVGFNLGSERGYPTLDKEQTFITSLYKAQYVFYKGIHQAIWHILEYMNVKAREYLKDIQRIQLSVKEYIRVGYHKLILLFHNGSIFAQEELWKLKEAIISTAQSVAWTVKEFVTVQFHNACIFVQEELWKLKEAIISTAQSVAWIVKEFVTTKFYTTAIIIQKKVWRGKENGQFYFMKMSAEYGLFRWRWNEMISKGLYTLFLMFHTNKWKFKEMSLGKSGQLKIKR